MFFFGLNNCVYPVDSERMKRVQAIWKSSGYAIEEFYQAKFEALFQMNFLFFMDFRSTIIWVFLFLLDLISHRYKSKSLVFLLSNLFSLKSYSVNQTKFNSEKNFYMREILFRKKCMFAAAAPKSILSLETISLNM